MAEAHHSIDIDVSLDRPLNNLGRQNLFATCELIEAAKAINNLRLSKGIEYVIHYEVLGHMKRAIETFAGSKRKYDKLLDQSEQEARQRAATERVNDMFARSERCDGMGSK